MSPNSRPNAVLTCTPLYPAPGVQAIAQAAFINGFFGIDELFGIAAQAYINPAPSTASCTFNPIFAMKPG